jgi:hypothetical protein
MRVTQNVILNENEIKEKGKKAADHRHMEDDCMNIFNILRHEAACSLAG